MLIKVIGELPVLRDGSTTIGGFENIVEYLREKSDGQWDLNRQFSNPKNRADITAYSTLTSADSQPTTEYISF